MNCKLIFKTTTGSICPKGWKPTWESTLFRNASCLRSYLCLESCLRLTQSELRSDCTASVITEHVIDTALKAEIRHLGIVKVFHSLGCILRDWHSLTVPSSRMTDTVPPWRLNTQGPWNRHTKTNTISLSLPARTIWALVWKLCTKLVRDEVEIRHSPLEVTQYCIKWWIFRFRNALL